MTQEHKELLLKDLSARFPYNVAIDCRDEDSRFTCYLTTDILKEIQNNTCYWNYKPYLFPMSSMTEEQRKEYGLVLCGELSINQYDWLNAHHFDYRGLIPMGLANDATGLNIY